MFKKILIANRGEIAMRIVRTLREMGISSVAVYAEDDVKAPHVDAADEAYALERTGPDAYLDSQRLLAIARQHGCDALHPGYGFLSEQADFALACAAVGVRFIGPTHQQLALFGDKAQARALAQEHGVPLMPGIDRAVTLAQALQFFHDQGGAGVMVKAIGGGGGWGMRAVQRAEDVPAAFERCQSEAQAAFGQSGVYVERLMTGARHIEVQVVGDGQRAMALGDRECTVQRRFQKVVEIAPSPSLDAPLRQQLTDAALKMATAVGYEGLGTFEFLVDMTSAALPFVFIEANPRLQVEHTVTEEVMGVDLVQIQVSLAAGLGLADLGLNPDASPRPRGYAIQWRINAETMGANGTALPSSGQINGLTWPAGPGIRIDAHAVVHTTPSPHYDTLLAKIIVSHHSDRFMDALLRSRRALDECHLSGLPNNISLLRHIAAHPDMASQHIHTRWLEERLAEWLAMDNGSGASGMFERATRAHPGDANTLCAPMAAKVKEVSVSVGDRVHAGQQLMVLEAMKMEHVFDASAAGLVTAVHASTGQHVASGHVLIELQPQVDQTDEQASVAQVDPDHIRPDLQRVVDRHAFTEDARRPAAVAKRHAQGGRTARENLADLCDADSFTEYGALAIAAQTRRRSLEDLMANTPADGMVTGIGTVNAEQFGPERSRAVVMAYDYTVLAGTQGMRNHHKTDRMLALAHKLRLPVVLFAEGGGGRPGDTDMPIVAGLNNHTFSQFAALSGKVPVVGIAHGRCFAGNAALLGCADVIIATQASNIGMSGPAMIEGGGLGVFKPEDIGPAHVHSANGVIDVLVRDEAEAVATARQYLSYFQGPVAQWQASDQRALRHAIPENRLRVYEVRDVMRGLVDEGSLLELRQGFGPGMVTALARIQGRPVGLMANNPKHLGGAIDVEAADKAARFMQLCNAHGLPIVSLTDTPGFMVGPDIEAQGQVRHVCRMFVVAAHLTVPFFAVVLRKGYGLGAQAMTAGGFDAPVFTIAWPTGEFGAMGLEGAVRLGFRKDLEAAEPGPQRDALFDRLVKQQYANGEAMNMAATLEIDAVIDPAETRTWLVHGLASSAHQPHSPATLIDTW